LGAGVFSGVAVWGPRRPDAEVAGDYPWLAGVNPLRGTDAQFEVNCLLTGIATDLSLATGEGHRAGAGELSPERHLLNYVGDRQLVEVPGYAAVVDALERAPVGARGMLVVSAGPGGVSHVVVGVRDARGVVFLDGQSGRQAELPARPARLRFVATGDVPVVVPDGRAVSAGPALLGSDARSADSDRGEHQDTTTAEGLSEQQADELGTRRTDGGAESWDSLPYESSDELLDDLLASVKAPKEHDEFSEVFGPDLFGVRNLPRTPGFLMDPDSGEQFDYGNLSPDE